MDDIKDSTRESCRDFMKLLASSSPAPGGGGASAIAAALGAALGEMVAALTLGKKSYAAVEEEIGAAAGELAGLRDQLMDMVAEDARGFLPLSEAYRMPKELPEREEVLEKATVEACSAPYKIMELSCRAMELVAVMGEKGSRLAVSDAGCAAAMIKAAVDSAALNLYINTKSMKNRVKAGELNAACSDMHRRCGALAEEIYRKVESSLLNQE